MVLYFNDLMKDSTPKELKEQFRHVLNTTSKSGLKFNKNRSYVGSASIEYFRFHNNENGIRNKSRFKQYIMLWFL